MRNPRSYSKGHRGAGVRNTEHSGLKVSIQFGLNCRIEMGIESLKAEPLRGKVVGEVVEKGKRTKSAKPHKSLQTFGLGVNAGCGGIGQMMPPYCGEQS